MSKDTFTALIVDDEELARGLVREHLQAHPEIQIIGECANGFEAVKAIAELKPDLLFLDIQMPKLDGFEVLELVDDRTAAALARRNPSSHAGVPVSGVGTGSRNRGVSVCTSSNVGLPRLCTSARCTRLSNSRTLPGHA